ncbi:MAG TPA: hypothetical protein PK961_03200 [bacterium]|nr:hypothetical protein [bacterium]
MKTISCLLLLSLLCLPGAACKSVIVVEAPVAPVDAAPVAPAAADPWLGEWVEFWPAETDPDIYCLDLDEGNLRLTARTHVKAQRLERVRREGNELSFVAYVTTAAGSVKELRYRLTVEDNGEVAFGTVEFLDGSKKEVQWHKKRQRLDGDALLQPQYDMRTKDWVGEWTEDWPGSATHDRYRIAESDDELKLLPLSNAGKQSVENATFGANRLRFTLHFGEMTYDYLLVPVSAGVLNGRVQLRGPATDGQPQVEFVQWRKVEP